MCGVSNPPRPATPPAVAAPPAAQPPAVAAPPVADQDGGPKALGGTPAACVDPAALQKTLTEAVASVALMALGAKMLQSAGAQQPGASCCSCVPPPPAQAQGGLQVGGVPGFPDNAIRTQGGYTVVPEGKDQAWKIYGPGQQFGDDALTRVWGDPHVNEADGTRWDFTRDSNFTLPDGTLIRADTTSETGKSVTQGLTIVSGNDRVDVTGVNGNHPSVSKTADGQSWLQQNAATLQAGHTFQLQHEGKIVDWFRSTNGQLDGLVTGARANFDGKDSYDQTIDAKKAPRGAQAQALAAQPGQTGTCDMDKAMGLFGLLALGGLGFLGNSAQVQGFMKQVGTALSSLLQQSSLSELFNLNASRAVRI
jgi:hypothetical protein